MPNSTTSGERRRIDVHHHIAPPSYVAEVGESVGTFLRSWSVAKWLQERTGSEG